MGAASSVDPRHDVIALAYEDRDMKAARKSAFFVV